MLIRPTSTYGRQLLRIHRHLLFGNGNKSFPADKLNPPLDNPIHQRLQANSTSPEGVSVPSSCR